jgi:hypothetical protein
MLNDVKYHAKLVEVKSDVLRVETRSSRKKLITYPLSSH